MNKKISAQGSSEPLSNECKNAQSLLLVEDDTVLAGLWQVYLQKLGYNVDCCSTVQDAEVLLRSNQYQLLIVDLFLREDGRILEEGGVTLINRVRLNVGDANFDPENLMILVVTGAPVRSVGKFSVVDTIKSMADSVMHKPIKLDDLGEEVKRLITVTA